MHACAGKHGRGESRGRGKHAQKACFSIPPPPQTLMKFIPPLAAEPIRYLQRCDIRAKVRQPSYAMLRFMAVNSGAEA